MSKKQQTATAPQPTAPSTPAEWLDQLRNQREQVVAQLNQIIGAIALCESMIDQGRQNGEAEATD